jgi:hypothetical protein
MEAYRPGAWFPGPLGPYHSWIPGIGYNWDFERVKVPWNPDKKSVLFLYLLGQIISITICAHRQPNYVKHLLSGLKCLQKAPFTRLYYSLATTGACAADIFRSKFCPAISGFSPLTGISARGPQGRSDTALRPNLRF